MLGVQYSFVASINTSNAVIATLFQFLAPIFIIVFVSWIAKSLATRCASTRDVRDDCRVILTSDKWIVFRICFK